MHSRLLRWRRPHGGLGGAGSHESRVPSGWEILPPSSDDVDDIAGRMEHWNRGAGVVACPRRLRMDRCAPILCVPRVLRDGRDLPDRMRLRWDPGAQARCACRCHARVAGPGLRRRGWVRGGLGTTAQRHRMAVDRGRVLPDDQLAERRVRPVGVRHQHPGPARVLQCFRVGAWTWVPSLFLPVAVLPAIYPTGRPESRVSRVLVWSGLLGIAGLCFMLAAAGRCRGEHRPPVCTCRMGSPPTWLVVAVGYRHRCGTRFAVVGGLLVAVIHAFSEPSGPERAQMLWLLVPIIIFFVTFYVVDVPWAPPTP